MLMNLQKYCNCNFDLKPLKTTSTKSLNAVKLLVFTYLIRKP